MVKDTLKELFCWARVLFVSEQLRLLCKELLLEESERGSPAGSAAGNSPCPRGQRDCPAAPARLRMEWEVWMAGLEVGQGLQHLG